MSTKEYLKKICSHTGLYFTAATLLLILFNVIVNNDLSRGIHPGSQALLLPFSLIFATANMMFRYGTFKIWERTVLHYVMTVFSVFCFLYLPNLSDGKTASQGFAFFCIVSVIYIIIMGVILGLRARINRVKRDEAHYKSVYKQGKGENSVAKNSKNNKKDKDDYQSVFKKK